ncbi:MAG TPA: hypothetical protein QGG37_03020 [Chloroflexota bacterium]|nr:hypothetical protein [Chloroflexota bacterium]
MAAVARVLVLPRRDEILTILQDEVDEPVLLGESEPEPALEQAANEIEKLLVG